MKEKTVNEAARTLVAARWKKKSPEERSAIASEAARAPRTAQRCFCGQHSMLRAAARYFDCCRKAGVITLNLERRRKHGAETEAAQPAGD